MRPAPRQRFVIDPVWKLVNQKCYEGLWKMFLDDCENCGFIGFDMEWSCADHRSISGHKVWPRPNQIERPVATVQLSSLRVTFVVKFIDVFSIVAQGKCEDPFAPFSHDWPHHRIGEKKNSVEFINKVYQDIVSLLRNESIIKVGVGIHGDQVKFQRDFKDLILSPCVDLVALAAHYPEKSVKYSANKRSCKSLKDMSAKFAGITLNKDYAVIRSNWGGGLGALSKMQISYAAADSEASFDVCYGILVKAGLLAEDISSPLSILNTSCLSLLKPVIMMPKKETPNATKEKQEPSCRTSGMPPSYESLFSNKPTKTFNDAKAPQGDTRTMLVSSMQV